MSKPKINTSKLVEELSTGSAFFAQHKPLEGQADFEGNIHKPFATEETNRPIDQASNKAIKQAAEEQSNKPIYNPSKEDIEEGSYVGSNIEILAVQREGMKDLIRYWDKHKIKKNPSIKKIMREALDDYLRKEVRKL